MSYEDFRLLYLTACLGLALIILSPTIAMVVRLPHGEAFSELWVLGAGHMAEDYPFKIEEGEKHSFYLGVANHMGSLSYYRVLVKFRNQTEPLPNPAEGSPSILKPIFEYRLFLSDGQSWEKEIPFSLKDVSAINKTCKVSGIIFDDQLLSVEKQAYWNEEESGFYFQLFFELWIYNASISQFQYHNRFVGFWLNITGQI